MDESSCVRCGAEWEEGYLTAGRGIGWRTRPATAFGFLRIEWLAGGWLALASIPARRCRRCRLVLAEYEDRSSGQYERGWI